MRRRELLMSATGIVCAMTAGTLAIVSAQAPPKQAPALGSSVRYCNPLSIETSSRDGSPQGVHLGDVTVVREGGKYYLFGSGGGGWVSEDLVNWKYKGVEMREGRVPVAPHVAKYNGQFYMSGNDAPLYRAPGILGPYEVVGPWTGRVRPAVLRHRERPEVGWHVRRRHLRRRRQHAVPLLPDALDGRHLRGPARSAATQPARGGTEAAVRIRPLARLGALRRDERVPRRLVDRGLVDAEAQGHLLPAVQRVRHPVAVLRDGHVHGQRPTGAVQLRAGEPDPPQDHRGRHRHRPRLHRRRPRRQPLAVLHHRAVEPARRTAHRHGSRRLRRARQLVREGPDGDTAVGPWRRRAIRRGRATPDRCR